MLVQPQCGQVVAHTEIEEYAFGSAVAGDVHHVVAQCVFGRAERQLLAVDAHVAVRGMVQAGDGAQHIFGAGSDLASDAGDGAGMDLQVQIRDPARHRQPGHRQADIPGALVGFRIKPLLRATQHQLDQFVAIQALDAARADMAAIAENCDRIAQVEDLAQTVRDVDDRSTLAL